MPPCQGVRPGPQQTTRSPVRLLPTTGRCAHPTCCPTHGRGLLCGCARGEAPEDGPPRHSRAGGHGTTRPQPRPDAPPPPRRGASERRPRPPGTLETVCACSLMGVADPVAASTCHTPSMPQAWGAGRHDHPMRTRHPAPYAPPGDGPGRCAHGLRRCGGGSAHRGSPPGEPALPDHLGSCTGPSLSPSLALWGGFVFRP